MNYDVLAVNLKTNLVRLVARDETVDDAETNVGWVIRRGDIAKEFFVAVATGTYAEGEVWTGQKKSL